MIQLPPVVSAREYQALKVTEVDGYIELGIQERGNDRTSNAGADDYDSDAIAFDEILHLNIDGSIMHSRLLHFNGSGDFRMRQETSNTAGDGRQNDDRLLLGGKLDLNFLQEHPYQLDLHGEILDATVDPKFGETYDVTTEQTSAIFSYDEGPLPFRIGYIRDSTDASSDRDDNDQSGDEFFIRANYDIKDFTSGDLTYRDEHTDYNFSSAPGETDKRKVDLRSFLANNITYLDESKQDMFIGRLVIEDGSNIVKGRLYRGTGLLRFRHSETLSTNYDLNAQRRERDGEDVDSLIFNARLRHQFWLSLTTQPRLWADLEDAPFGTTRRYGGELTEDYTKKLGDWGRLSMSLIPRAELQERRPTGETGFVIDESVVLANLTPVALAQRDVDRTSIHVTDASGLLIYTEGLDYTVTVRGLVTELTRILTGDIGDPETVLVDYEFNNADESDILDRAIRTHVSLNVHDWIEIYSGYTDRKQKLLDGVSETKLDSSTRWLAGLNMTGSWMSARIEFEDEKGTFTSYQSLSETLSVYTPGTFLWNARCSATHTGMTYRDTNDEVDRWSLIAVYRQRIGQRGWLDVEAEYLRERWDSTLSRANDIDAFRSQASYNWDFRSFEFELGARVSVTEQPQYDEINHRVFMRFIRNF